MFFPMSFTLLPRYRVLVPVIIAALADLVT
jgi:hypothetical protein